VVSENRVELGGRRKLHYEEHHNLFSSPNIIRVIKSRRIKWVGHVARMRKGKVKWRVLRLRMEGRPQDTEGSCEYIE
jgi:hypothetical protein